MRYLSPTRGICLTLALCLLIAAAPLSAQYRRGGGGRAFYQYRQSRPAPMRSAGPRQAPVERRQPPAQQSFGAGQSNAQMRSQMQSAPIERRNAPANGVRGEHLGAWMNQHSNLTPQQQQQALEREPGFRDLPAQTQQRMRNHLAQLDAMPPEQRQRLIAHNEWMEHLTVDQRAQVRGPMEQLGSLPEDQRLAVGRSFRELRGLPPDQRMAAMNSGRYGWMNENQRNTLNNLLRIEPLLPPTGR